MKRLFEYIRSLFKPKLAVANLECPYCRGFGYDYSGLCCGCVREIK
jgi:hypothetical protein